MAKKKSVNKKPEPTADEVIQADVVALGEESYHATFTPTWRPEVDCGDHVGLAYAKEAIDLAAEQYSTYLVAKWEQAHENIWLATGFDGEVETNMPIAKIVRVTS